MTTIIKVSLGVAFGFFMYDIFLYDLSESIRRIKENVKKELRKELDNSKKKENEKVIGFKTDVIIK